MKRLLSIIILKLFQLISTLVTGYISDPLNLESVSEILLREKAHGIPSVRLPDCNQSALPLSDNLSHLEKLGQICNRRNYP